MPEESASSGAVRSVRASIGTGKFLAIAVTYWGMGLISEWIGSSSSPWFPLWLPAGISFAALLVFGLRYWPAVAVGAALSFALILGNDGLDHGFGQVAIGLGGAALAEAMGVLVGVWFFKQGTVFPRDLQSERGAILFFVGGTLVGPSITSAIMTAAWCFAGLIPGELWLFTFLSLMMARAVGVSTVSPLLLLSESEVRRICGKKVWVFGLAGGTALLASVTVLAYVGATTERKRVLAIEDQARRIALMVERDLEVSTESIESIRSLWDSSRQVDQGEFGTFCRHVLNRSPWIRALMWAPLVEDEKAEALQDWIRAEGGGEASSDLKSYGSAFTIRRRFSEPDGAIDSQSENLVPVVFCEPDLARGRWLGVDLRTDPGFGGALTQAKEEGDVRGSAPFSDAADGGVRVLMFTWIDQTNAHPGGIGPSPLAGLSGYAIALVDVESILQRIIETDGVDRFEATLTDDADGLAGDEPFLRIQPRPRGEFHRADEAAEQELHFAGCSWRLRIEPHRSPGVASPAWNVVGLQSGAFMVSALLGAGLLAGLGHTARVNMEVRRRSRQLAEFEERFRQISENIDEVFWVTSLDGQSVEFLSRAYETIWGRDREEVMAEPGQWQANIHPDDLDVVLNLFSVTGGTGGFDLEFRIVRPDGEIRWIRNRAFPVSDDTGKVVRMAGVAEDVTAIKDREKSLRDAKRESEEAGRILERFFFVSLDMLCIAGLDGYFKRVNPAFSKTLGFGDRELLETPFIEFVHPDDVDRTMVALNQIKEGEIVISFENRMRHADGGNLWIEWNAVPDPDHSIFYAAARDVTGRRETEDELRRSNAELEQFAYVASHDLQEPLRMVTSFMQLLKKRYGGKLDETADQYIFHAVDGAARMRRLILGFLELSRVGRQGMPIQAVDSMAALEEALKNSEWLIRESGARIERGPLPKVMADMEQLTVLFQNLIGNSIKFCRERTPELSISALPGDGIWVFSFEDNGPGIPGDQRERVFQIFQRLQPEGDPPGMGIGLAICRRILDRHGGRIWIEESTEGGARFCFTLRNPLGPPDFRPES